MAPVTTMLTWQSDGASGLEAVRVLLGAGGFRALGRIVRAEPDGAFSASYRLVVDEDGGLSRLSVTSATSERERHLTMNRTDDGFWLLDTGSGSSREEFGGSVDVDLEYSPLFNTLPIRRLGLHREPGEHTLAMVRLSLPDLQPELMEQTYRTVSVLADGHAVVEFRAGEFVAEIVVDEDGLVVSYPQIATRLEPVAPTG